MKTIRIPAEIILTFPPQVRADETVTKVAIFACEQHLNSIGIINYNGPMLQTGALSFGLRVHMADAPSTELKGQVVEVFPSGGLLKPHRETFIERKAADTESISDNDDPTDEGA